MLSHLLKLLDSSLHQRLKVDRDFNSSLLNDALWPIPCCRVVEWRAETKNWLPSQMCRMIDIETTNHGRPIKERHIINSPRYSTNLCANLDQYLAYDWSYIFSSAYCADQNNLWNNWNLFKKEFFYFVIKDAISTGARKKKNYSLNRVVQLSM